MMEVLGKGSVTILDPAKLQTDAYEVKRHKPIMVSGVILHSLPSGYRFDLRKRRLRGAAAPGVAPPIASWRASPAPRTAPAA